MINLNSICTPCLNPGVSHRKYNSLSPSITCPSSGYCTKKCSPSVNSNSSSSKSISSYGRSGVVALSFNLYEPGGRYPVPVAGFVIPSIKSSTYFHSSNSGYGSKSWL